MNVNTSLQTLMRHDYSTQNAITKQHNKIIQQCKLRPSAMAANVHHQLN